MSQIQSLSRSCVLLAVLCGKHADKQQRTPPGRSGPEAKRLRPSYPFPELSSAGRLEVHTLVNPTPEQFLEAQRVVQPNFFYIQGQQLEDEEIGSLVWGDADMSDPQSFVCLISPPFPTIVYLEVPIGEKLAQAVHSKGIPYVIYWRNSFSSYAASHFRNALFSVVQSSVSHTWDSFQLAHASFRLYCVRNNHVQSVKLGPRLLGDAPKVNVVIPENEMAEEEGSSSEVSPAIKIYDDDINMKFLLCGVPSALDSCLLGSLEDGLNALLNIDRPAPPFAALPRRARRRATPPTKLHRAPPRRHPASPGFPIIQDAPPPRLLAGPRDAASSLLTDMISSSPLSRPRLAPRPVPAAASPCRARLAVAGGGARGLAAGVRCQAQAGDMDAHYMRRCVELARTAAGHTSPNPMVGCVIVREGKVVGEGFHPKAGQPHAEVFALRDAGDLAENATAYVSLEPCNHYGRTPPCSEALIKAKVKEVVVGMTDPNPIVASKGIEKLRNAGIDVRVGVEEALCLRLNEAYIHRMLTGKAFATLRATLSMNGIVINQIGSGTDQPGGYYSQLAKEYDGVIISSDMAKATALPMSREAGAKQPLYIIIAQGEGSKLDIPFLDEESASNAIVLADSPVTVEPAGVSVSVLDQMNLESILQLLADRGLCSVLVDFRDAGGVLASLLSKFQEDKLVQKVVLELSPVWMVSPGQSDLAFGGSQSFALKNVEHKEVNGTLLLEGYL